MAPLHRRPIRAAVLAALVAVLVLPAYGGIFGKKKPADPGTSGVPPQGATASQGTTPPSDTAKPSAAAAAADAAPADQPAPVDDGKPKLDAAGNEITEPAPPPCVPEKHKKCPKKKKEKPPKVEPVTIARGIFTVDGVIGKAGLNFDIPDLHFIYFYAPGIGAVTVSDNKFAGAVEQKDAFNGHTLTVKIGGDHTMQLYSDEVMLSHRGTQGKVSKENKHAEPAYVVFDSAYTMPTKFPMVGYGNKPGNYEWPGSKLNSKTKGIDADAPTVPVALAPKLAANACPAGQVLMDGKTVVAGAAPTPAKPAAGSTAKTPTAGPVATITPTKHMKCVPAGDVPAQPEKYIPLDQRPRS